MFCSVVKKMRPAVLTYFLILSLLALSVSAKDFEVSVFPTERTVMLNESALFEIELQNHAADGFFEVYSNDVTWDIRTQESLQIGAGKSFKTSLIVTPLNINPGAYNIPINFKRVGSSEVERVLVYVGLLSPFAADASYLPGVRGVATVDRQIDPRESVVIKISLENQNRLDLRKIDVKMRSSVINKDYTTSLGPLEKKTLTFNAEIDPKTSPQKDALQISIIVPEGDKAYQFDLFPLPYEVSSYGGIVSSIETEKYFLKSVDNILLVNEGNRLLNYSYRVPSGLKTLFLSSIPAYEKVDRDRVWEVMLHPGGQAQLVLVYNYRPVVWVLLVIAVLIASYFGFRSPVSARKSASVVSSQEGGISEVKIVLELINRSNKTVKDVAVIDLVPPLIDVLPEFRETLAPSKIVPNQEHGTLIKWDIASMDSKEHRIFVYSVRTKLGVFGGMSLPVAAVNFIIDGNERETVSNKAKIKQ